jgi:phage-related protein
MPGPVKSVLEWWKKTKQTVSEALDWVAEKWGNFTDWCVDIGNSIIDGLSSAYDAVVDWASGIIDSAKEMISKAWEYCKSAV